jgi:hypothetical protein
MKIRETGDEAISMDVYIHVVCTHELFYSVCLYLSMYYDIQ